MLCLDWTCGKIDLNRRIKPPIITYKSAPQNKKLMYM